jgi:hypothetical protein
MHEAFSRLVDVLAIAAILAMRLWPLTLGFSVGVLAARIGEATLRFLLRSDH